MADDVNPSPEPPLVTHVEVLAPARPRPGLITAILWCLGFLAVQITGALVVTAVVLAIFAFQAPDAGRFLNEQLAGLGASTSPRPLEPGQTQPPLPPEMGQSLAYGMLGAQLAALLLIAVVVPRCVGSDWKRQLGVRRPAALHVFLVVLLAPGFLVLASGIQELVTSVVGITPPSALEAINSVFRTVPWYVTFLSVALGPGIVEEMWCRGFLGRGLCARYGLTGGIVLTSLLFALMHMDPSQVIVITLMGAYLHFVYLASRSIWVPILLHILNNGLAILIALTMSVEAQLPAICYLVAFSLMLFASVALWTGRAAVTLAGDWKPEYPGISTPPPGMGALLDYERVSPVAMLFTLLSCGVLLYLLAW